MHRYFEIADSVIFFNEQDRLSATKHADHSGFLEKILSGLKEIPSVDVQEELRTAISIDSGPCWSFLEATVPSVFITNGEVRSLSCKMLIGEVSCQKGQPIRFKIDGNSISTKPPFTMEFGVWRNVNFIADARSPVTLKISGILIAPEVGISDFLVEPGDGFVPSYSFERKPYAFKSVHLTRVPPTTAEGVFDIGECMSAPPNIGIFGLIRSGKGFQKMLDVIEKIHKYHKEFLPITRLKIAGKPLELGELAEIVNRKFGLVEYRRRGGDNDHVVTDDLLESIACAKERAESKRSHYDDSTKNRQIYDKKLLVRAEDIIRDIIARESGQALGVKSKSPSPHVTMTTTTIAEEKKAAEDDGANASAASVVDAYFNEVLMSSGDNAWTFAQAATLLREHFDPVKIAGELVDHFDGLIQ